MNNSNRLKFLRIIVCLGLVAGMLFSLELWFPLARAFPRAPLLFSLPESSAVWIERIFSAGLMISPAAIIFTRRARILSIVFLFLLILLDQNRLQPWVYQYFLLLVIFALRHDDDDQTLGFAQIIIAGLYVWSGAQKLNYSFSHETLPALLSIQLPFVWIGLATAFVEMLAGFGLLFRRTRNVSVCLAIVIHASILVLLIAKNYNSVVWVWNAALILLVAAAFWRSGASLAETFRTTNGWKTRTAKSVAAASVLLPFLSFFGWWDMFLSGALYSGNVEIAVVRIDEDLPAKLPPRARQNVFQIKSGEKMLPLFEWSINELNVPVYPEERVFRQVAREVCKLADDKGRIELIIRKRPAILDGSYKTVRISCAELEK